MRQRAIFRVKAFVIDQSGASFLEYCITLLVVATVVTGLAASHVALLNADLSAGASDTAESLPQ